MHAVPQLISLRIVVMVPLPVLFTVRVCPVEVTGGTVVPGSEVDVTSKPAVTLRAAAMLTVHVLLALVQAPVHPVNVEPAAGVAVSVTLTLLLM